MLERIQAGPPAWLKVTLWTGWALLALVMAVTIMVQWFFWLAVTMLLFSGWGGVIGGLIVAVQIWLMFGTATKERQCG